MTPLMKYLTNLIAGAASLVVAASAAPTQNVQPVTPPAAPVVSVTAPAPAATPAPVAEWFVGGRGWNTAGRTMIILNDAPDSKSLPETEEDLNVMAHILEKAAVGHEEKSRRAMGISVFDSKLGGAGVPRNLYIEGHGALFFLNVDIPLLAPPAKSTEADTKDRTSTEWEEARRELNRPSGSDFQFNYFAMEGAAEEFDADKVDDLKKGLLTALKNAAHIRKLKSDETVTVIVTGRDTTSQPKAVVRKTGGGAGVVFSSRTARTASDDRATRLILRARKSDLEAFQKDQTSFEEFRKKVTVMLY